MLQYYPGGGIAPAPEILTGRFNTVDLDPASEARSSLQAAISQGSSAIAAQARNDLQFLNTAGNHHPQCPLPPSPNLLVYTYVDPYTFYQASFLGWLHAYAGLNDILPPKMRANNSYVGNQICPWGVGGANIAQSFGYAVYADASSAGLYLDNRLNPWRWNAPINTIHAVEQPSFALISRTKPGEFARAHEAFQKAQHGWTPLETPPIHIYLDYEIDLYVYDARTDLGESSIWDIPGLTSTLYGKTLSLTAAQTSEPWLQAYANQRYIPPTFQLSLMVNFREDSQAYILNEFLLSSFNYATTEANATNNPTINTFIFEGGTNYYSPTVGSSWYRLRVDALKHPGLASEPPMVVSGGDYAPVVFTNKVFQTTLQGRIDLTNYYKVAHGHQFFPGQKPTPDFDTALGENNGINWAGMIFENHGPFVVSVGVRKLNVSY